MSEPVMMKGRWSLEEDNSLRLAVQTHGPRMWAFISGLVPGRTAKSCRRRWCNQLSPRLNHGPFTIEEDRTLLLQYATLGRKWARIARMLNGRSDNAVKNRFERILSFKRKFADINEADEEDEDEGDEDEEDEDEEDVEEEEDTDAEQTGSNDVAVDPHQANAVIDHELPAVAEPAVDFNSTSVVVISDYETEMNEFDQVSESTPEQTGNNDVTVDRRHANPNANAVIDLELQAPAPAADFNSTAVVVISDSETEGNGFDQVSESTADPNLIQLINKIVNEAVDKSMSTLKDQMDKTISTVREEMSNNIATIVRKEVARYNSKQK